MRIPPKLPFDALVEERIQDAMRRGEFDDLPGAGRPLVLEDDRLVPEEVRAAYRVLKNAGFVPPEILDRREIANLEALLPTLPAGAERTRAIGKLALLQARLGASRTRLIAAEKDYARKVIEKLAGGDGAKG